jgi:prephenate dehydrogenase
VSLNRVTIIGLGLMGGSLALALRRAGLATHIVGCARRPELLRQALETGVIDSDCEDAGESVAGSDYVFLCTPVETSIRQLAQIAPRLRPGAVVSDVGSTKNAFALAAQEIFGVSAGRRVLPGHPLAGREVSGLGHADANLYAGCLWVLTPITVRAANGTADGLLPSHYNLISALEAIGARVIFSTPVEHDRTLAYTSHLPQLLSTALGLTLEKAFGADNPALQVHAGGLQSMLRLAASDPAMWEQIAASNQQNLAAALESVEAQLKALRQSLGSPEFRRRFEQAREFSKTLKS